ncbi:class I tRNA ligase family protein, partial [Candidatus Parcubacteria bacterium]|nr:class I tRNA ligase family protein [Candidatus Parcubacteria bacterium]
LLYKRGLAYKKEAYVNWCSGCQTVLANEQVIEGRCYRSNCQSVVEKRRLNQWFFRITDYAENLLDGLDGLDGWPENVKTMQRNWIGKSEGCDIRFKVVDRDINFQVFTTRPDTIYGVTFMSIAPEHPAVDDLVKGTSCESRVRQYIQDATKKTDRERIEKEKDGVATGCHAINPVNGEKVPIFVADYVLSGYGTGAIMAVPAHDERDFEFAKKYNLPIRQVVRQKEKRLAIIIHGFETKANDNWFPWAKKELEQFGFEVILSDMPNANNPKLEEWMKALEKYKSKINSESIIIGHSLGAHAVAHFVSGLQRKIAELYLVAPASDLMDFNDFKKEAPESDIDSLEKFCQEPIDWKKVKENTNHILSILSDDDPYIPIEKTKNIFKKENIKYKILHNKGHLKEPPLPELSMEIMLKDLEKMECFTGEGISMGLDFIHNLKTKQAKEKMIEWLEKNGVGERAVNYKLRDWVFSRQRYWGEPIPIIHCKKCGVVAVPEKELPVKLPEVKNYEPSGTGESPLANIKEWVNTKCPKCGGPAKRETNTMPQWAGSSWYYLRYIDPHNDKALVDKEKEKYWSPVDFYVGGAEHATRHLIYARFWHKFLYDIGAVSCDEPFKKLRHVGLIMAEDGRKMSKRWGNVINPDDIVEKYGADSMRVYEMFMGPFSQSVSWNTNGLKGAKRFLDGIWNYIFGGFVKGAFIDEEDLKKWLNGEYKKFTSDDLKILLHKTIKKVGEDIENFKFNTAISQLMIFKNSFHNLNEELNVGDEGHIIDKSDFEKFLIILSPFAPFMAEELWSRLGNTESIFKQKWPEYDPKLIKEETINLAIQVNGKLRGAIEAPADILEKDAKKAALESEKIKKWIENKNIIKIIFVKGRLINIVIK